MGGQGGQLVSRAGQHAARHSMGTGGAGVCLGVEGRAWMVEGLVEGFVASIAIYGGLGEAQATTSDDDEERELGEQIEGE